MAVARGMGVRWDGEDEPEAKGSGRGHIHLPWSRLDGGPGSWAAMTGGGLHAPLGPVVEVGVGEELAGRAAAT